MDLKLFGENTLGKPVKLSQLRHLHLQTTLKVQVSIAALILWNNLDRQKISLPNHAQHNSHCTTESSASPVLEQSEQATNKMEITSIDKTTSPQDGWVGSIEWQVAQSLE